MIYGNRLKCFDGTVLTFTCEPAGEQVFKAHEFDLSEIKRLWEGHNDEF